MHKIVIFFLAFFSGMALAADNLEAYNRFPKISSGDNHPEPGLIKYFKGMDFKCHNDLNTTPKENPEAEKAFNELIKYNSDGDRVEDYWYDANHKKKQLELLSAAVKSGSWKAIYLDSVWAIKYPSNESPADMASAKLSELVSKGIPIVAYKYATYLYGRNEDSMYYLFSEAIKRGNPNAMAWVGGVIVARENELHPLGEKLLECAVSQNYAEAYNALGVLAFNDGRRLDAYHLWAKGINEGCNECVDKMSDLAKVRPGYAPHIPQIELMPELKAIKEFYDNNFFYELTELPELSRGNLPDKMKFHPKDSELLNLLKLERESLTQY